MFDANGFPLWIALVALLAAGLWLARQKRRGGCVLNAFDREATLPLRGVLVSLVVLGHLKGHCAWATDWLPWVGWATPAVAIFFFLSGYGLCRSYDARGDGYLNHFLGRSIKKLMVPLLPVVLCYAAWLQIHGRFVPLFLQFWKDGNTPVPNTWYVYALIMMYALWWGCWKIGDVKGGKVVRLSALWMGVAVYFAVMEFVLDWNFVWARTIFAFPLGATFAEYEKRIKAMIQSRPLAFYIGAIAFLMMLILCRAYVPGSFVAIAGRGLTSLLGLWLVLVWYAFTLPTWGVFRFLGGISYELYLVHGVVIALALPLLRFGFGVFAGVVIVVSIVLAQVMRRVQFRKNK